MSDNLGIIKLAPGSDNAEVVVNTAFEDIDAALTETFVVDLSSANASLTLAQLRRAVYFRLNGATAARVVALPQAKRIFYVKNYGSADVTLEREDNSIVVAAGTSSIVRLDGTADGIEALSAGSGGGGGPEPAEDELPPGGTTGQLLAKASNADGDVDWVNSPSGGGLPTGGTYGQILKKASNSNNDLQWEDWPSQTSLSVDMSQGNVVLTKRQIQDNLIIRPSGNQSGAILDFPTNIQKYVVVANSTSSALILRCGSNQLSFNPGVVLNIRLTNGGLEGLGRPLTPGGLTGRVLVKKSNIVGDAEWNGFAVPNGGTTGQVLKKQSDNDGDVVWAADQQGSGGGPVAASGSSPHRFWRIVCLVSNHDRYFVANEIEMRNTPAGSDLTVGGAGISNGSYNAATSADKAFDKNMTTYYEASGSVVHQASNTASVGNWIGYDFGTPVAINHIILKLATNEAGERMSKGQVQYSDDGVNYIDAWLWDGINQANNTTSVTVNPDFDNGTLRVPDKTLAEANAIIGPRLADTLFIKNGRKAGEAAGAGTGVMCYYQAGWKRFSNDLPVEV